MRSFLAYGQLTMNSRVNRLEWPFYAVWLFRGSMVRSALRTRLLIAPQGIIIYSNLKQLSDV